MEDIDLTANDDITLFTDDEHVPVQHVNREFRQHSKLKGIEREYTIFNDNQCYQKVIRKHGGKQKYRVSLCCLDPEPRREFNLADSWLVMAAIGAITSFLLIYLGWFRATATALNHSLLYTLISVSVSFCCICILVAILKTRDRLLIYSKCGRAPVLEMINNNPDKELFMDFMNSLSRHILLSRKNIASSTTQLLALELKELRRLRNEGVIADSLYESAKSRIFRNKAYQTQDAT